MLYRSNGSLSHLAQELNPGQVMACPFFGILVCLIVYYIVKKDNTF